MSRNFHAAARSTLAAAAERPPDSPWVAGGWEAITVGMHPQTAAAMATLVADAVGAPPADLDHVGVLAAADDRRDLDRLLASYVPSPADLDPDHIPAADEAAAVAGPVASWRQPAPPTTLRHPVRTATFDDQLAGRLYAATVAAAFDPGGGRDDSDHVPPEHRSFQVLTDAARQALTVHTVWRELVMLASDADEVAAVWRSVMADATVGVCAEMDRDACAAAAWLVASTRGFDRSLLGGCATGRPSAAEADGAVATIAGAFTLGVPTWRLAAAINASFRRLDTVP